MKRRKLLIVGHIFPESRSTAAGWRMMKLIEHFHQAYDVYFGTAAQPSNNCDELVGVKEVIHLPLNDDSVDETLLRIQADVVVFDRFYTEEMFGWRVAEVLPDAWRILNSEDIHFVRATREQWVKQHKMIAPCTNDLNWTPELVTRELASILRSHKTIVISRWEMDLLQETFQIPSSKLSFLPLQFPQFETHNADERKDFCFIGNGIHKPNADAIEWLVREIWPRIQERLPSAKLNIACGYTSSHLRQLLSKKKNIQLYEQVPDAGAFVQQHAVQLMPIRFGAGIKGKVLESIVNRTPFVATPIAMEGISNAYPYSAENIEAFVEMAVSLYSDRLAKVKALTSMNEIQKQYPSYTKCMDELLADLAVEPGVDWFAQTLLMQQNNATKFFSKYITAKNQSLTN